MTLRALVHRLVPVQHINGQKDEINRVKPEVFRQKEAQAKRSDYEWQQQHEFALRHRQLERIRQDECEELKERFGFLNVDGTDDLRFSGCQRVRLLDLLQAPEASTCSEVYLQCRIHQIRRMSSKLVFLILRQQIDTIQAVMKIDSAQAGISTTFVRWAEHIPIEAIVLVRGKLSAPRQPVEGTTIHSYELQISHMYLVSSLTKELPFSVQQSSLGSRQEAGPGISQRTLLGDSNRIVHLRSPAAKIIMQVQSAICNLFRSYLDEHRFLEIHTPKLQRGATESGSSVFKVNYFGRTAFLAQSPQLCKQMSISADFDRVYEIGPVFRAENSNTHRHLTEYVGLDIEMALENDYYEMMRIVDGMLKHVFKGIYERFGRELDLLEQVFPHQKLLWLEETPILRFDEAIQMLLDSGWKHEDGSVPSKNEDMATQDEIRLGELVRKRYNTDYYIIDKFPASARPFYTMPDASDRTFTNSFDIFVRGQEITTGGQRIHDASMLEERLIRQGISLDGMQEYLDGFRWAAPPHAGAGIGLERLVMLLLNLGDIRHASLFYRDPKSLPAPGKRFQLRHPEASTLHPVWQRDDATEPKAVELGEEAEHTQEARRCANESELPLLEDLIANYGDAANTTWLDDRYKVWRDLKSGAAVGYVPSKGYAIIVGAPLCDSTQYGRVIADFLDELQHKVKLSPIWIMVSEEVEQLLGVRFGWSTLTCIADERADLRDNKALHAKDVQRKLRHAKSSGLKVIIIPEGEPVSEELQHKLRKRMDDWKQSRTGRQIHLTELNPFRDHRHRRYLLAESTQDGKIHGLVVLAQLSMEHGFQVKYSLDFPEAPSGTIELLNVEALQLAASSGATTVTFGVEASEFHAGHNLSGIRVKMLSKSFNSISKQFRLRQKGDFRRKLGGDQDGNESYVCYPRHSLGTGGVRALLHMLGDQEEETQ
ncbi:aspartate--tRNA ligase dps1 [Savitreella phatthalungensis]